MRNSKGMKFLGASLMALFLGMAPAWAGSGPTYCHDEAKNAGGSNRCKTAADCDGARTCSPAGWCQGNAGHAAN